MAIGGRKGSIRDIRSLAERVHQRLVAYRRQHRGYSPPVSDTISRILEHTPDYIPPRQRIAEKKRPPLKNPGIFTVQEDVAEALGTTVGDLLGEPGYAAPRDLISVGDRRKLREVVRLLRDLFDLDDESLDAVAETGSAHSFVVPPERFIERDYDYPHPLGEHDPVIRMLGSSMEPELRDGWQVLVDPSATTPVEGALVAVYHVTEGGVLGRWNDTADGLFLRRTNPHYRPLRLAERQDWRVWGTVTRIVDAPVA